MLGRWARGIIGRLRRPIWYVFHFPHASPDGANLALRAICLSGSWWGYDFIASPRLSSWWACGEFTGRKKGSVDFDLWIYGL